MANTFILGADYLFELGEQVSKFLEDCGVYEEANISINIPENDFKKVDEDLFYRMRDSDKDEFTPSDSEIELKFKNLTVMLKKKVMDGSNSS